MTRRRDAPGAGHAAAPPPLPRPLQRLIAGAIAVSAAAYFGASESVRVFFAFLWGSAQKAL